MIIRYQKYNFTIEASEPLLLPVYKGSTFRGAFGNAFKRVVYIPLHSVGGKEKKPDAAAMPPYYGLRANCLHLVL